MRVVQVIGKIHKDFSILSFQIRVQLKSIQNTFLNSTWLTWLLKHSNHLSRINRLNGINHLIIQYYFLKKHLKLKNDTKPFIPQIRALYATSQTFLDVPVTSRLDKRLPLIFNGEKVTI